jgi:hypothetical protein
VSPKCRAKRPQCCARVVQARRPMRGGSLARVTQCSKARDNARSLDAAVFRSGRRAGSRVGSGGWATWVYVPAIWMPGASSAPSLGWRRRTRPTLPRTGKRSSCAWMSARGVWRSYQTQPPALPTSGGSSPTTAASPSWRQHWSAAGSPLRGARLGRRAIDASQASCAAPTRRETGSSSFRARTRP